MRSFRAQFSVVDDILSEAIHGRLPSCGPLNIEKSGRIGPLVELLSAAIQFPLEYNSVLFSSGFAMRLRRAWKTGVPFGGGVGDLVGAYPLQRDNPVVTYDPRWEQWLLHVENVAKDNGVAAPLIASFIGALQEMQDNVYEHSGHAHTGLIAYAVKDRFFEFVVSDRGLGVLETLRKNPSHAHLPNAGAAMVEAIKPGISRFPSEMGRGQGYVQLYRAMVSHGAELRFRSGDHALTLRPTVDPLNGEQLLSQKSTLTGLTVSAIWRAHQT